MSEAAADRTEPLSEAGDQAIPRRRSPFGSRTSAAEEAARALFASTAGAPPGLQRPGRDDAAETGPDASGPPPDVAISLSELRHEVARQAAQLERAMDEVEGLNRRIQATRARAVAAETAVSRERTLRRRHSADGARRLLEHQRTIADLLGRIDAGRRTATAAAEARVQLLESRLDARARADASVDSVITRAREAIGEVRAELARRAAEIERLRSDLLAERRLRSALARRLAEAAEDRPAMARLGVELEVERRARNAAETRAERGQRRGAAPAAVQADLATACRRLEQELATRHALEAQAARLIGRLNQHLSPAG